MADKNRIIVKVEVKSDQFVSVFAANESQINSFPSAKDFNDPDGKKFNYRTIKIKDGSGYSHAILLLEKERARVFYGKSRKLNDHDKHFEMVLDGATRMQVFDITIGRPETGGRTATWREIMTLKQIEANVEAVNNEWRRRRTTRP